jgi:hypothetical protein
MKLLEIVNENFDINYQSEFTVFVILVKTHTRSLGPTQSPIKMVLEILPKHTAAKLLS